MIADILGFVVAPLLIIAIILWIKYGHTADVQLLTCSCPRCGKTLHRDYDLPLVIRGVEYWRCHYCGHKFRDPA